MTLNIAILGPGRIAQRSLAPAISRVEGIQLWSVLSRDRARAAEEVSGAEGLRNVEILVQAIESA